MIQEFAHQFKNGNICRLKFIISNGTVGTICNWDRKPDIEEWAIIEKEYLEFRKHVADTVLGRNV